MMKSWAERWPHGALTGFLLVILLLGSAGPGVCRAGEDGDGTARLPVLWAHRGYTKSAPENSLAALRAARDLGLAGSEVDIRLNRDGVPVLMHDETLDRTTDGRGLVAERTLVELKALRLRGPGGEPGEESLPTLAEVLDLTSGWPGFRLTLDLKVDAGEEAGRAVLAAGMKERVTLSAGGPGRVELARKIKSLDPGLRLSVDPEWWWKVEGVPLFMARALGAEELFATSWNIPDRGFGEVRKDGREVNVFLWGGDVLREARKALALGATGISCDRPDLLLPLLEEAR